MPQTDPDIAGVTITSKDSNGYIVFGEWAGSAASIPTTASKFAIGCILEVSSDGTLWQNVGTVAVPVWSNSNSLMQQVSLTAAQINGMYAAPVVVVAAVPGKAIIVDSVEFDITRTSTQFASGGTAAVQYDSTVNGAGTATHAVIAAAVITAGAGRTITARIPVVLSDVASASIVGLGLYLSNISGAFTTGTGTAKVTVRYHLV